MTKPIARLPIARLPIARLPIARLPIARLPNQPERCTQFAMDVFQGAFDPEVLSRWVLTRAHPGWLGLRYRAHGPDWVELELPWRADLVGDERRPVLASGPIISLMDMAAGMAIWAANGSFQPVATLDLRVDYLRPARERASVFGRVTCYRRTRSAAFVRGTAHDGDPDEAVAELTGVFMVLDPARMT